MVSRVLQVIALLSALFVVAARGLVGFPLLAAFEGGQPPATEELRCATEEPSEQDSVASVDSDDSSDDDADHAVAPTQWPTRVPSPPEANGPRLSDPTAQRPLPSHAPSLDRPPRSK